ncbi:enkurin-like [Tubulanus polymorphus]|uniref:enkurin-like n=1 Tax=Tubulanus polymorphus TaxID=672921 RepID=UPI003DA2D006
MASTNESIYNLIPRDPERIAKDPRHISKFKTLAKDEYNANKGSYKTMGPAKVDCPTTDQFLKKHEKEPRLPESSEFKYTDSRKPPVPKPDDRPVMGLRTTKNFITTNAVENIMSVPKKPEMNYVDTKCGDKRPLEPSGLVPKYLNKKDFGKTPLYLSKRKDEIKKAQEEYDHYVSEHFRRGAMRKLEEYERQGILDGLKTNWEELHHQYQGLSVVTDTAPKKNRKERMEAEMKQLERDIEMIEKHTIIYLSHY